MGKKNKQKRGGEIQRGQKSKTNFKPTMKNDNNAKSKKEKHLQIHDPAASKLSPLQLKMKEQLESSRFRWINEQLYTSTSTEALELMTESPDYFDVYHKGYRAQVEKWPVNPVDVIIAWLRKQKDLTVVDLGCGDAKIAQTVQPLHTVHSFDLVAANKFVKVADSANVPLAKGIADVVVFCLSLMGTNLKDFLQEAVRLLNASGMLYIAEVKSRIEDIDSFIVKVSSFGFKLVSKNVENTMFVLLQFQKVPPQSKPQEIRLMPCLYKKR